MCLLCLLPGHYVERSPFMHPHPFVLPSTIWIMFFGGNLFIYFNLLQSEHQSLSQPHSLIPSPLHYSLSPVPTHFSQAMFIPSTPHTCHPQVVHQMPVEFPSFPHRHTCSHFSSILQLPGLLRSLLTCNSFPHQSLASYWPRSFVRLSDCSCCYVAFCQCSQAFVFACLAWLFCISSLLLCGLNTTAVWRVWTWHPCL